MGPLGSDPESDRLPGFILNDLWGKVRLDHNRREINASLALAWFARDLSGPYLEAVPRTPLHSPIGCPTSGNDSRGFRHATSSMKSLPNPTAEAFVMHVKIRQHAL